MRKLKRRLIAAVLLLCVVFAVLLPLAMPLLGHSTAHACHREDCRLCNLLTLTSSLLRQLSLTFAFCTVLGALTRLTLDNRARLLDHAEVRSLISDNVRANA